MLQITEAIVFVSLLSQGNKDLLNFKCFLLILLVLNSDKFEKHDEFSCLELKLAIKHD